jgi:hypothetical protein
MILYLLYILYTYLIIFVDLYEYYLRFSIIANHKIRLWH